MKIIPGLLPTLPLPPPGEYRYGEHCLESPTFNRIQQQNTHLQAQNPHGPVHAILTGIEQGMWGTQPACLVSERLQKV